MHVKIKEMSAVLSVVSVTGNFDLFITILVNSRKMLRKIIENIDMVEGIAHLETHVVLHNIGQQAHASKLYELMKNNTQQ